MKHLILRLEAPLMAFGGETIDNYGVIRWFPSASMLTGLLANALGWRRTESCRLQQVQERLVFAARIDREPAGGVRLQDFQSAAINNKERSWTTRGCPEGRAGGTFQNHLRYRDYWADMCVTVAFRLEPAGPSPTLSNLAAALKEPARPLFIGRKPCLPSSPIFNCFLEGENALDTLLSFPPTNERNTGQRLRVQWPGNESHERIQSTTTHMITDQRNWTSGLHGGGRLVSEGEYAPNEEQP